MKEINEVRDMRRALRKWNNNVTQEGCLLKKQKNVDNSKSQVMVTANTMEQTMNDEKSSEQKKIDWILNRSL